MIYVLIVYLVFVAAYILFSVAAIYHLKRFGFVGDLCGKISLIYWIASTVIILVTFIQIVTRDWPVEIIL